MGGWKSHRTVGVKLDPATVRDAISIFRGVLSGFNGYLSAQGAQPVKPQRPVGSVSYFQQDAVENPSKVYGDIDYLVSFPCADIENDTDRRKIENQIKREYEEHWIAYLTHHKPAEVDVDATLRGSPWLVIVNLPGDRAVQVDIVITFPKYCDWMGGRYEPERGRKGLIMGHMFKALGDQLMVSIGTEGVIARTRNGQRVPSKFRKGVTLTSVSTDIDNFLVDIARYIIGKDDIQLSAQLRSHPGITIGNVTLANLCKGIVGLAQTLAMNGAVPSAQGFLESVLANYKSNMASELNKPKYKKANTPEQFAVIKKLRNQIQDAVSEAESILSTVNESVLLRQFVRESLRGA